MTLCASGPQADSSMATPHELEYVPSVRSASAMSA